MPKVVHTNSVIRRVEPAQPLELRIAIGHAQTGQWWVKLGPNTVAEGTETEKVIALGPSDDYFGKTLQVEVRCDDTNPQADALQATIELTPVEPALSWVTDNEGQQTPHGSMTSFIDIFIRKAI